MENIAHQIVGTWRLVHSIQVNSDGKKEYPYGEDAVGYIYYSNTGLMRCRSAGNPELNWKI